MTRRERWPWALPLAAFLLSVGVSTWSFKRHFEGALTHEFCNYAEIGRNIVEGHGLRTRMVYPFTLALLDARGLSFDGLAPVLDRFPLQAALSGLVQGLLGVSDASVAALSALQLGLVAGGTAAAGLVLFGPVEAALAAALIALDPSFQRAFVLWGQPDFGFAALVLALTLLTATMDRRGALGAAAAGGIAALAWMQRPNLMLWLPLFAWSLWRGKDGRRRLALFAASAFVCALPAMLYYRSWYGSLSPPTLSWNLAHHVVVDTPPWLHYRVFTLAECLERLPELSRKFFRYLFLQVRDLPGWWQMLLISPAAAAGAWRLSRGERAEARTWVALHGAMLALQLVAFSFLRFELLGPWVGGRYYLWAAPCLFLLGAHAAVAWGKAWGRPALVVGLFTGANLLIFLSGLASRQGPPAYPGGRYAADWPELGAVARLTAPDGLVATNLPGQVSWYARRSAVALPVDPADLLKIDERHPVDTILVSRLPLGELVNTPGWKPFVEDLGALQRFAAQRRWVPVKDFGSSILLVRAKAASLEPKPPARRAKRRKS
ncbi:MAG: hypothetical protein HY553_14970 [Elusimicrobia bacterium]|nr:hypothetical protein [Elusimicrobiota bacterium]